MSSRLKLALTVLSGYTLISFCVGNFYPFSVFDMYSHQSENGSRIVAKNGEQIDEVDRYLSWHCEGEIDLDPQHCGAEGAISTSEPVERELIGWVRSHGGDSPTATPIDLVRRTWFFSSDHTSVKDCLLAHCRAVPR